MTRENKIMVEHVPVNSARLHSLFARHRAFWERPAGDNALFVTQASTRLTPIPFLLRQSDGGALRNAERLRPDMFDVPAMVAELADWEPAWEGGVLRTQCQWLGHAGVGDSMPMSLAPGKMPWVEAMLGCPIALVDGEPWIAPYPGDPEEIIQRGANFEHTPWFQLYLEFLRQLQVRVGDRFPVTTNTLIRGPGDLVAAVMGVQAACLAWIERPRLMARLLRICTDAVLQMIEAGNRLLKPFQGGYPETYGTLAPGPVVSTQDDYSCLISADMYKKQILPYAREIIQSRPYSVLHLHSGGLHIAPLLLEFPELTAIEVSVDSPPAEGRRPYEVQMLRAILEHKSLIVDIGPPYLDGLADYEALLAQLPRRGLFLRASFEPADYAALPEDFPGRRVWLLG